MVCVTGYAYGLCVSTSLQVNRTYVITAYTEDAVYKANRTITADWYKLSRISEICGLEKLYPYGRFS